MADDRRCVAHAGGVNENCQGWVNSPQECDYQPTQTVAVLADDLRELLDNLNGDLGQCPYLAKYYGEPGHNPDAMCIYGCDTEPECMTCQPTDDWPSRRLRRALEG